jgi:hypothetical protein
MVRRALTLLAALSLAIVAGAAPPSEAQGSGPTCSTRGWR